MNERRHGGFSVRDAGDAAVLLQLAPVIDPAVNARAIAIAAALRTRHLPGVRDVVSTFRSVAVYFDPLVANADVLEEPLLAASRTNAVATSGRVHEVPVRYGGEAGPDLSDVAAFAGVSEAEVIARHSGADYRVFMLGFQPGFGYLGLVDPSIAVPRRATPRVRIPAGSVGIASRQTGIYPVASPGGWQIVGRTPMPMLDRGNAPRPVLAPGDTVRFIPRAIEFEASADRRPAEPARPAGARRVTVLAAGLFTTIQDSGRWGEQGSGMPVSGAMDRVSHQVANIAVGNDPEAAALEVTLAGAELRVEQPATLAIAGADLSATLDDAPCARDTPIACRAGSVVRFRERVAGARAYLAFDGGVATAARWPIAPLRAGDVVTLGEAASGGGRVLTVTNAMPRGGARLRVLIGPQDAEVADDVVTRLLSTRFTIAPQSNRMGYRLRGEPERSPLRSEGAAGEMISDATFNGAVQVPPSGEPILLMADRQTTGGYPQVVTVISADLPVAGQLAPGDWVEFSECSRAEAVAALRAQHAVVHG